jgi:hypothetical protein
MPRCSAGSWDRGIPFSYYYTNEVKELREIAVSKNIGQSISLETPQGAFGTNMESWGRPSHHIEHNKTF